MRIGERIKLFRAAGSWPNITLDEFAEQMKAATEGQTTRSGVTISTTSAMGISAFFCGVSLITGSIASCSYLLYKRIDERSRERYTEHPLYGILHDRVNLLMTAHQWKRTTMGHLLLWGNAYSMGERDPYRGTIISLSILHPSQVKVFKNTATGELSYEVIFDDKHKETLTRNGPRFIFHIPGPGFNGVTGYSVLSLARESLGLTAAMEQFGQLFFGQGVNAGGFLLHPSNLSKEAQTRLKESVEESNSGISKSHKWAVLEEGMKFERNTIPLEDAQFLTSRTFQIQEVARWLNIAPHKLKELTRATFSNIEHQQIEDIVDCYRPWCCLIEAETNMQLIEPDLQGELFAEFLLDSLLRGDTVSRNQALAVQRQWGIISANQWRAVENMNPQEGEQGEKYLVPSNMMDAKDIGKEKPAPTPGFNPFAPQPGTEEQKPEEKPKKEQLGDDEPDPDGADPDGTEA